MLWKNEYGKINIDFEKYPGKWDEDELSSKLRQRYCTDFFDTGYTCSSTRFGSDHPSQNIS